ncbi:MAG: PEP-CTERM sorting domain-containing protein [Verrucomicrobiae bacterium]
MTALKKIFLVCSIFLPLAAGAVVVDFSSGNLTANWTTDVEKQLAFDLALTSNPGNIFGNATMGGDYIVDDRSINAVRPYGQVFVSYNTAVSLSSEYLRLGSIVDGTLTYSTSPTAFLSSGNLTNSATSGTDNYLGVSFLDTSSQPHYGWLQFELHPFSDGSLAVKFLAGDVLDVAGISAQAGTIPEPSAIALMAAAGAGLALAARSRRKSD